MINVHNTSDFMGGVRPPMEAGMPDAFGKKIKKSVKKKKKKNK